MKRVSATILVPRWVLTIWYCLFIPIGLTVFFASSPSLDLTTGGGYTALWAILLGLTGTLCAIGSLTPKMVVFERWTSLLLSALLLGYAFAPLQLVLHGDSDKAAFSVIALVLSFPTCLRNIQLLAKTGVRKHD